MAEWQDISTAPQDGTPIVIPHASYSLIVVQWAPDPYMPTAFGPAWRSAIDPMRAHKPTHWMPLPPPPVPTPMKEEA